MAPDDEVPKGSLKDQAAKWVFNQGVSTVLLLLLVFGVYRALPWIDAKIDNVQAKSEASAKEARKEFREINDQQRKESADLYRELKDVIEKLAERLARNP